MFKSVHSAQVSVNLISALVEQHLTCLFRPYFHYLVARRSNHFGEEMNYDIAGNTRALQTLETVIIMWRIVTLAAETFILSL